MEAMTNTFLMNACFLKFVNPHLSSIKITITSDKYYPIHIKISVFGIFKDILILTSAVNFDMKPTGTNILGSSKLKFTWFACFSILIRTEVMSKYV